MKTSAQGIELIKGFEGCLLTAYQDMVGVWTIGYGFTLGVNQGDKVTQEYCDSRLRLELGRYERAVFEATQGDVSQTEFDALVSFAWNVGMAGMKNSSVIKAHFRGDKQAAARAFGLWNKAGGKPVAGLTRRRAAEAALYLTQPLSVNPEMPQAVDAEKPMVSSTTVIAGGTATLASVTQLTDTLNTLKSNVSGLGDWLLPALAIVSLLSVGYIIYERFAQRRRGNA